MAGTVQVLLLTTARAGLATVDLAPGSGLVLLPLADERGTGAVVDGFYELTAEVAGRARELSRDGVVAYLHSEFFGGGGFHAAVAWRGGEVVWGPMFTATSAGEGEDHYTVVTDRHEMAANVLLRWLGVERGDSIDEFAAAGLNRFRWTEEWAAASA